MGFEAHEDVMSAQAETEKSSAEQQENTRTERQTMQPAKAAEPRRRLDPTRYGDWEKNGRCIDF